jgi:hypothetical protein
MLSRRGFLSGMAAAGLAPSLRPASPSENPHPITPVQFEVPEKACDCHVHVFGDPTRFPFVASRTYTPESASGAAVMLELRPPLVFSAILVGVFAIFHGHAHATELPPGQSALLYSMGFVIATGYLHAVGIPTSDSLQQSGR